MKFSIFWFVGISFTPHETGTHLVNVYKDRAHIPGSPFKIDVTRNEVGDATKVRVYGEGLYRGNTNQLNQFIVDTRDAGNVSQSCLVFSFSVNAAAKTLHI